MESTGGHTKQKQRQQQKNSTESEEEEELVSDDVKSKPKEKGWKAEVTTHEKNTVEDITLADYMASYVAVVGANDAGRVLCHQTVHRCNQARTRYVWRLTDADGHESLENQNKKTTEDVEKKHLQPWFTVLEGVQDFQVIVCRL